MSSLWNCKKINFCRFKSPICGTSLWQPQETNTLCDFFLLLFSFFSFSLILFPFFPFIYLANICLGFSLTRRRRETMRKQGNKVSSSFYVKTLGNLFKVPSPQWASTIWKNRFKKFFYRGVAFKLFKVVQFQSKETPHDSSKCEIDLKMAPSSLKGRRDPKSQSSASFYLHFLPQMAPTVMPLLQLFYQNIFFFL